MIKLFAGLGNPGKEYENTRHNFGFIALNAIAEAKRLEFKNWNNVADISFCGVNSENGGGKIFLFKPLTFMNLSGTPLAAFMNYYKILPEEIAVLYDDFSIPLGEFRLRMSGSDGGHNGIKSIIRSLNTQNFARMKLGIGKVSEFMKTSDYVLSKFRQEDKEKIELIKQKSIEFFDAVIEYGLEKAVSTIR
ncbi:MAG: aminoacyl-tRNA hydrolase [Endomicrobium sp.]|jgi:PTH1 family peptidyl-tRNA hydrolase|nr:aminoacyl-tRNA hydrolase [Endomicrobium sp.]